MRICVSILVVELFHPRRHTWSQHFALDGPAIVGLTAIGRATARLLKMNDRLRLALRAELFALGDLTIEATDTSSRPNAPKEQDHETD